MLDNPMLMIWHQLEMQRRTQTQKSRDFVGDISKRAESEFLVLISSHKKTISTTIYIQKYLRKSQGSRSQITSRRSIAKRKNSFKRIK
jgi:hypothetical protein